MARKTGGAAGRDGRYRVVAVATHPVQYSAPVFRRMAKHSLLDLHVAYCTLRGAETTHDPGFGAHIQWDVPLLDGYSWTHVPNRGSGHDSFFGLFNPGLWKLIRGGNFDAVICLTGYRNTTFWIALLAAKFSKTAFLFGTDAVSLTPPRSLASKSKAKEYLWPRLFRLAHQVIVPSTGGVDLIRSLGIPQERITLTPFVLDNDWWIEQSKLVDGAALRASSGVSHNDVVILFSAKLQPWKRSLDLLRAYAKANLSNGMLFFSAAVPLRPHLRSQPANPALA